MKDPAEPQDVLCELVQPRDGGVDRVGRRVRDVVDVQQDRVRARDLGRLVGSGSGGGGGGRHFFFFLSREEKKKKEEKIDCCLFLFFPASPSSLVLGPLSWFWLRAESGSSRREQKKRADARSRAAAERKRERERAALARWFFRLAAKKKKKTAARPLFAHTLLGTHKKKKGREDFKSLLSFSLLFFSREPLLRDVLRRRGARGPSRGPRRPRWGPDGGKKKREKKRERGAN